MKTPTFAEALAGEREQYQDEAAGTLPHAGNLRRYALVADGAGGRSESWIADPGSVNVRIGQQVPQEPMIIGERLENQLPDYHITWPAFVNINQRDRLLLSDTGRSYELVRIAQVGDFCPLNEGYAFAVDQPYTTVLAGVTALQPVYADNDIVSFDFFHEGVAVIGLSKGHKRIVGNWRCQYVAITANSAPGVGATVFDVLIDKGVGPQTIFATSANRPTLGPGVKAMVTPAPDTWQFNDGDFIQVNTVSIGDSGTPGADITLQVIVVPR